MDSPVRQLQKRNDYLRHKMFRKINRRRRAKRQLEIEAPVKELKKRLRLKRTFEDGKDEEELVKLPEVRVDSEGNVIANGGRRGTVRLPEVFIKPDDTKDKLLKALNGNETAAKHIIDDMATYKYILWEGLPGETELPANYELNRLIQLINDADNPKVYIRDRKNLDKDSHYDKETDYYRAYALPLPLFGSTHHNNYMVVADPDAFSGSDFLLKQYIAELSHALLFRGGSFGNRWRNFKRRSILEGNNDKEIHTKYGNYINGYNAPNNTEYEAHEIIEPSIWKYLRLGENYDLNKFWAGVNHDIDVSKRGRDNLNPNAPEYATDSNKANATFGETIKDIIATPYLALDLLKWSDVTKAAADIFGAHFNSGKDSGIHIKPENRGKFTRLKKRTGHSTAWFKAHGTPALKKMATFALNAKKWHHK